MKKHFRIILRLLIAAAALLGVILVAIAAFLGYLAIARNTSLALPDPTGSYPVGRMEFDWTDASRPDALADQGSPPRELVVWAWYPAAKSGAAPAPYLPAAWVQARDKDQGIGVLIENAFNRIRTHSFEGVPTAAAPDRFPVVILLPGMGPMMTDYTTFAENLASHGYAVFGINPTDTSNWTVFPDGRVALRSLKGAIPDRDTPAQADADGARILSVWTQDVLFVMDQAAGLNADPASIFKDRLDLAHLGIGGHSFGGATALAVCQQDPRCKAGVDMDGIPFGAGRRQPVPAPFLSMTEDYSQECDRNCELIRQAYEQVKPGGAYLLSVTGSKHFNFSDLPYRQAPAVRPLFALADYEGSISPARGLQIANAYLVAFFDQYLKGTKEEILQGPSPAYPEVIFEKR